MAFNLNSQRYLISYTSLYSSFRYCSTSTNDAAKIKIKKIAIEEKQKKNKKERKLGRLGLTRTRAKQWAIADSLGLIPKDGPETCHHNFNLPRRGWLPRFCASRGTIWMATWRTLPPRRNLHAPGAINVHGGVSPGEPPIRTLRSGS